MASPMVPSPLNAALTADTSGPSKYVGDYSRAHRQDGRGESAVGAPRIHGELRKLGLEVSERTVSRLLRRRRRPPSQTWRTFLTNHLTSLVSLDFFTVPTVTGRVLFVLVLLSHHRRRIVHLRITEHPTAA